MTILTTAEDFDTRESLSEQVSPYLVVVVVVVVVADTDHGTDTSLQSDLFLFHTLQHLPLHHQ